MITAGQHVYCVGPDAGGRGAYGYYFRRGEWEDDCQLQLSLQHAVPACARAVSIRGYEPPAVFSRSIRRGLSGRSGSDLVHVSVGRGVNEASRDLDAAPENLFVLAVETPAPPAAGIKRYAAIS